MSRRPSIVSRRMWWDPRYRWAYWKAGRRHARLIGRIGGAMLIAIGVLLVTGAWEQWMAELRSHLGTGGIGSNL